jgi:hypothetical protein
MMAVGRRLGQLDAGAQSDLRHAGVRFVLTSHHLFTFYACLAVQPTVVSLARRGLGGDLVPAPSATEKQCRRSRGLAHMPRPLPHAAAELFAELQVIAEPETVRCFTRRRRGREGSSVFHLPPHELQAASPSRGQRSCRSPAPDGVGLVDTIRRRRPQRHRRSQHAHGAFVNVETRPQFAGD